MLFENILDGQKQAASNRFTDIRRCRIFWQVANVETPIGRMTPIHRRSGEIAADMTSKLASLVDHPVCRTSSCCSGDNRIPHARLGEHGVRKVGTVQCGGGERIESRERTSG